MNLDFKELQKLIDEHSTPWTAYTCSTNAYRQLKAQFPGGNKDSLNLPVSPFAGMEVWEVPQQTTQDVIEWMDKELMMEYLEFQGVIEKRFKCDACKDTGYFDSILEPGTKLSCGMCRKESENAN